MSRIPRALVPALLFAAVSVNAAGLPDTGQDTCYNETAADGAPASGGTSVASEGGTHPRQDCRYGRDAAAAAGALTKTGGGAKGFDYTKVGNNGAQLAAGAALGAGAADWACTRDNITGLTWEIKTGSGADLRYADHTYTWYNSDDNTNGGNKGTTSSSTCNAVVRGSPCNTEAFVTAVNALDGSVFGPHAATAAELSPVARLAIELGGSALVGGVVALALLAWHRVVKAHFALFIVAVCIIATEVGSRLHLDALVVCLTAGLLLQNALSSRARWPPRGCRSSRCSSPWRAPTSSSPSCAASGPWPFSSR